MAATTHPHLELQREVCLDLLGRPVGQRLGVCGCVPNGKALPLAQIVRPVVDLQKKAERVGAAYADTSSNPARGAAATLNHLSGCSRCSTAVQAPDVLTAAGAHASTSSMASLKQENLSGSWQADCHSSASLLCT